MLYKDLISFHLHPSIHKSIKAVILVILAWVCWVTVALGQRKNSTFEDKNVQFWYEMPLFSKEAVQPTICLT